MLLQLRQAHQLVQPLADEGHLEEQTQSRSPRHSPQSSVKELGLVEHELLLPAVRLAIQWQLAQDQRDAAYR